jgi:hypothetical protein
MGLTKEQAYLIEQMKKAMQMCNWFRMLACQKVLFDLDIIALPDGCGRIMFREKEYEKM